MSARDFLVRGLLAGLFAGIAAFGLAYVVGEPSVNAAIAFENSGHAQDAPAAEPGSAQHDHATEVPRSLQSTLGLLTGTVVAGTTIGGLVGVLSALALGRFGGLSARATTMMVSGLGFVGVYLVPFTKYPPNPPSVGEPGTIGYRTELYFLIMAISLIAVVAAALTGRRLIPRLAGWHAFLLVASGFLVVCGVAVWLMPSYQEVPDGFPATVLYDFRIASLVTQLTLWGVLGVSLTELVDRLVNRAPERRGAELAPADS